MDTIHKTILLIDLHNYFINKDLDHQGKVLEHQENELRILDRQILYLKKCNLNLYYDWMLRDIRENYRS